MEISSFVLLLTLAAALFQLLPPAAARQNYSGLSSLNCAASDELAPSPAFLYTCNGLNRSCQSFLIFRSTLDYSSPAEIAELTSSDAAKIAEFNAIADDPSSGFELGKDVIVPVTCSCSGDGERYYRANTSFTVTRAAGTYYVASTVLFDGLATCAAIRRGNPIPDRELKPGMKIQVPLRCACPSADGLYYLHNFTKPAYVHQDIKTSNVLLNSDLRAKITNFSLARSAAAARDTNVTVHLVGTRGYMAPEYVETGEITPKIDVYAFGVVLLELITGKEAVLVARNGKETLLSTTVVSLAEKGGLEEALTSYVDANMGETGVEMALPLFRLSLACLRRESETRPNMEEVVSSLVKILTDLRRLRSFGDDSSTDRSVIPLRRASRNENDWSVETASW
ncbi:unnamed protein product [Linum tenue]|uniref:Protein kinase domain-containing protein n=1 Tax=Linum tenue TaxID=586396 RepID=A0AAV0KWP6_9ROSI|nr:unnamed protein product [Linum tenue]